MPIFKKNIQNTKWLYFLPNDTAAAAAADIGLSCPATDSALYTPGRPRPLQPLVPRALWLGAGSSGGGPWLPPTVQERPLQRRSSSNWSWRKWRSSGVRYFSRFWVSNGSGKEKVYVKVLIDNTYRLWEVSDA